MARPTFQDLRDSLSEKVGSSTPSCSSHSLEGETISISYYILVRRWSVHHYFYVRLAATLPLTFTTRHSHAIVGFGGIVLMNLPYIGNRCRLKRCLMPL